MKAAAEAIRLPAAPGGQASPQELRSLLQAKDDGQFYRGLAAHVAELTGATTLIYSEQTGTVALLATRIRISLPPGLLEAKEVKATLAAGLKSRTRVIHKLNQVGLVLWAMALEPDSTVGVALLLGAAALDASQEERLSKLLTIPQALFGQRKLLQESESLRHGLDQTCFFLDTLYRASSAPSFRRGIQVLAEDLRTFVGAEYVAVGLGSRHTCRVEAIAPSSKFDHRSQVVLQTTHLMRECVAVNGGIAWPPEVLQTVPGLNLAGDQDPLLDRLKAKSVTAYPLKAGDGEIVGCWVCWWPERPSVEKLQLADAVTVHVGATARTVRLARPAGLLGFYQRHVTEAKWNRRMLVIALLVIFAAAMFVPIPYRLGVSCWIDPEVRRQVAVPFDGVLARAYVEPGQTVKEGEVLAELDGKETGWKLAEVQARLNSLTKKRDQSLAAENMSEAQLAALEMDSLEAERRLLHYQNEHLQIRSPLDGVVISGDLAQSEGVPVQRGQRLFDVAPINAFTVQLAVPASEIRHVTTGMPVSIRLESESEYTASGTVHTLEPLSRIHEGQNVFLGTATMENTSGRLRPGMQGKARINCERKSLGWILFHRPLEFIRLNLPW